MKLSYFVRLRWRGREDSPSQTDASGQRSLDWEFRQTGSFDGTVEAESPEQARLMVAEKMADARGAPKFDNYRDREVWIERRSRDCETCYADTDDIVANLVALFADELFPDGVQREINVTELAAVLSENRERFVVQE